MLTIEARVQALEMQFEAMMLQWEEFKKVGAEVQAVSSQLKATQVQRDIPRPRNTSYRDRISSKFVRRTAYSQGEQYIPEEIELRDFSQTSTESFHVWDIVPTYTLKCSSWDAALFLGLQQLGWWRWVLLVIGILTTAIAQITFCYIVNGWVLESGFPEPAVFRRWREYDAHDLKYMALSTGTSLASRVCSQDMSVSIGGTQLEIIGNIDSYMQGSGYNVFILVAAVWFFVIASQLLSICEYMLSLSSLPRAATALSFDASGEVAKMDAISGARFSACMVIAFIQVLLCFSLLVSGMYWLASTIIVEDLVMNALALAFILDVDLLAFSVLADASTKAMVASFPPIVHSRLNSRLRLIEALMPLLVILLAGCLISIVYCRSVLPGIEQMEHLRAEACDGNLNFVVGTQGGTGVIQNWDGPAIEANKESASPLDLSASVVHELISKGSSNSSMSFSTLSAFKHAINGNVLKRHPYIEVFCTDFDDARYLSLIISIPELRRLQVDRGLMNATTCKSLADGNRCDDPESRLLRSLCPETCGCDDPMSGLVLNTEKFGCPLKGCMKHVWWMNLENAWNIHPCEDMTVDELRSNKGWKRFLDQLPMALRYVQYEIPKLQTTLNSIRTLGCGALVLRNDGHIRTDDEIHFLLCSGAVVASLRPFCPRACLCDSPHFFESPCPGSCDTSNPPAPWHQHLGTLSSNPRA